MQAIKTLDELNTAMAVTKYISQENDCMLETQEGKPSYWSSMRAREFIIWSLALQCHKSIVISTILARRFLFVS